MTRDASGAPAASATSEPGSASSRKGVLNPADRATEILFGLIMVLTFTTSLSVGEAGRADVKAMLIGALGCNLAWGIIDAATYLLSTQAQNRLVASAVNAIRNASSPVAGRQILSETLPAPMLPAFSAADLERIRRRVVDPSFPQPRLSRQDYLGAAGVFLLVFTCTFPVVLPFLIWSDPWAALRISNAVAVISLFLTGYTLGVHAGRPWRVGLLMVAIGIALVAVAMALGG